MLLYRIEISKNAEYQYGRQLLMLLYRIEIGLAGTAAGREPFY